jgi:uncharacterized membrane protein
MFTGSPFFVRFRSYGRQVPAGVRWLVMLPGLLLTLSAIAILIWPELLAYLVASVMLFVGLMLTLWGWSMHQAERRTKTHQTVYYEVL